MLDKREQEVRWYWCLLEFECVICLVHDALCIPPSPLHMRRFFYSIYGMVPCRLWTNRKYVDISVCLNLNVSLFGVWRTMTPSQLHAYLLFKYMTTAMAMTHGFVLMLILVEYMERYLVDFARKACTWYWCLFELECVIAWYTMRYHNCILAC